MTDQEANEVFQHENLDCKIIRVDLGHYCGYVRRPEDIEPVQWRQDYDHVDDEIIEADVDVWGGITYGPDDDGWVGFDDAHAMSLVDDSPAETDREAVKLETKRLAEQIDAMRSST